MKRYIKCRSWYGGEVTEKRMVNQLEIVEYLKNNPYSCERDIMFNIYGFTRGGFGGNKKYAECLRRALRSGKISRTRLDREGELSKIFYYVPSQKKDIQTSEQKGVDEIEFDSLVAEAKRRGLVPGVKFKLIQGDIGNVNEIGISRKFYMSSDRLMVHSDDMRGCYTLFKDGVWVELVEPVEAKEMTLEQVCDALGYEVKIVIK